MPQTPSTHPPTPHPLPPLPLAPPGSLTFILPPFIPSTPAPTPLPPSPILPAPLPAPVPPFYDQDVPGSASSAPYPNDSELRVPSPPAPPATLVPSEAESNKEGGPSEEASSGVSKGALAGIVVGAVLGLILLACLINLLLRRKGCLREMRHPRYAYYPHGSAMTRHEWRRKGTHEAYVGAQGRIPPHRMDLLRRWQHTSNISLTSGGSMDQLDGVPRPVNSGPGRHGYIDAGMGPGVLPPNHLLQSAKVNGDTSMRSNPLFSNGLSPGPPWHPSAHEHHGRAAWTGPPGKGATTQHNTMGQGTGAAQSCDANDKLSMTLQQLLLDVAARSESAVLLQKSPGAAAGAATAGASGHNYHPESHASAQGHAHNASNVAHGQGLSRAAPSLERAPHNLPAFPRPGPPQSPLSDATHSGWPIPGHYQQHQYGVRDPQHYSNFAVPHSGFQSNGAHFSEPGPPAAIAWSPFRASAPTTGALPTSNLVPPSGQDSFTGAWQSAVPIPPSASVFSSYAAAPALFPRQAASHLQSMHEPPAYIVQDSYHPTSSLFLHTSRAGNAYHNP
ncbi:hypothetical protein DUNSADRAFT_15580 [Dunaliella salina]|uniref:Uncharacterized protein n=1 Tax=Dunaliella salina TaxID=3046 RepID=A0ABQ7G554_DUNSA|nr:hypothetical protein DUNSADRAFT_15580 [Dunaliella salina]|eukprot:KAF5829733.1 hypothetical protein DUNSADRAFT_15580 [Dunaliella salina]